MLEEQSRDLKVCLLGATQVGKSSIVVRFVNGIFNKDSVTTIGASFMSKTVIVDGKSFKFQIWDTAGQEKYRGLAPMYYRGAVAAILVYDITNRDSLVSLKLWKEELDMNGPEKIVIAIVGNKADLDAKRVITTEEGEGFANSINALFFETSALQNTNIALLFETICRRLPQEVLEEPKRESIVDYTKAPPKRKKSGGCC